MKQNLTYNTSERERDDMITNALIQEMHRKMMKHDMTKIGNEFNTILLSRDISSLTTFSLLSKPIEKGSLLNQLKNKKQKIYGAYTDTNIKQISDIPWRNGDEQKTFKYKEKERKRGSYRIEYGIL